MNRRVPHQRERQQREPCSAARRPRVQPGRTVQREQQNREPDDARDLRCPRSSAAAATPAPGSKCCRSCRPCARASARSAARRRRARPTRRHAQRYANDRLRAARCAARTAQKQARRPAAWNSATNPIARNEMTSASVAKNTRGGSARGCCGHRKHELTDTMCVSPPRRATRLCAAPGASGSCTASVNLAATAVGTSSRCVRPRPPASVKRHCGEANLAAEGELDGAAARPPTSRVQARTTAAACALARPRRRPTRERAQWNAASTVSFGRDSTRPRRPAPALISGVAGVLHAEMVGGRIGRRVPLSYWISVCRERQAFPRVLDDHALRVVELHRRHEPVPIDFRRDMVGQAHAEDGDRRFW